MIDRKSEFMSYKSIKVVKGNGGFGGPLVITPSEAKHKFIYITGGGEKPDIVDKIADLTGMEAVNGFKTSIPDEEIALAIEIVAELFAVESILRRGFRRSILSLQVKADL